MREEHARQIEQDAPVFASELKQAHAKAQEKAQQKVQAKRAAREPGRTWVYAHEDQLSDRIGPLKALAPEEAGLILIEDHGHARARPFHRQRLAIIFANQRQFALEQARRGVRVEYLITRGSIAEALRACAIRLELPEQIKMMVPAEQRVRAIVRPITEGSGGRLAVVEWVPHEGWLTSRAQFVAAHPGKPDGPWKMDSFYRHVRKESGILMNPDGTYVGGKVSFDTENRESYDGRAGQPKPMAPPVFEADAVTGEVIAMIEREFAEHPGMLDAGAIAATLEDAKRLWAWAMKHCLQHFGPYEDAMTSKHRTLFHTRISTLVNLHRLLPAEIVEDAQHAKIPLQSKEGFIRQMLGWREFMKHVHDATDGFRTLHGKPVPLAERVGDGGYAIWAGKAWGDAQGGLSVAGGSVGGLTGAVHPVLGERPAIPGQIASGLGDDGASLPPAYWQNAHHHKAAALHEAVTHPSGFACLDTVVRSVWEEAWSHHITRLMILGNISTLLDVSSRALSDWFHLAYSDAWDWVVEPNVLGMATFSTGEVFTTKPYVSGAAYIDKMSDYCSSCQFDPAKSCPITRLYWAFLERHKDVLEGNGRLMMPMRSLAKRSDEQKQTDARTFAFVRAALMRGEKLTPLTVSAGVAAGGLAGGDAKRQGAHSSGVKAAASLSSASRFGVKK